MSSEKRQLPPIPVEVYEHIHVCELCGYIHEEWRRFCRHIIYYHRISYKAYVVRTRYGNVWPLCSCGCGARAYKGISLRRVGQPVYTSACWKRLHAERTLQSRQRMKRLAQVRRQIINHPSWLREETAILRAKNEESILRELHASGQLDDDTVLFYDELLQRRIARLSTECEQRDRLMATEITRIKQLQKKKRQRKPALDGDAKVHDQDLVPAHLQLGLGEEELWKLAERAVKMRN